MSYTYSVTAAQARLPRLLKEAQKNLLAIQRRNETVAYVVSRSRMEAIAETLELLATPEAMRAISLDRSGKGRYFSLDELDRDH